MENENQPRFVTRELTVQERIYFSKFAQGDFESLVKLIQSRAVEPIDGLYDMLESEFSVLVEECTEAAKESRKVSKALNSIVIASGSVSFKG